VEGTRVSPVSPNWTGPMKDRSTHCPGLSDRPLNRPPNVWVSNSRLPVPQLVDEVSLVVVDVDELVGRTGTNARMFQWLAIQHAKFCQFFPWLIQGWFHPPAEVSLVVVVVDVVVVDPLEHPLPEASNFPIMPIAFRLTGAVPVLVTWTVIVVKVPDTDRVKRLAVMVPFAVLSELASFPDRECLQPMVLSPCPSDCLRTPTDDGMRVYPSGSLTTTGFSWRRARLVPCSTGTFVMVTVNVFPSAARLTGETVPSTSMDMLETVKVTE